MERRLAKKLIIAAIASLPLSVAFAQGGSTGCPDGFSGVVDAGTTDPGGKGPYQRVMTPKVKVRPDSVCRTDCGDVTLALPPKGTAEARLAFKADRYGAFECGGTFSCPAGSGRLLPFASQWCPNGRFVAANAFARLLDGATFVAKPSVRRSVNAFLFRDRHGSEVALAWEREAGTPCEIALPDGVTACDLYGNPIKNRTFTLGTEPVYFFGERLLEMFK